MSSTQKKIKTHHCLIFSFPTEQARTMFLGEMQVRDPDVMYLLNTPELPFNREHLDIPIEDVFLPKWACKSTSAEAGRAVRKKGSTLRARKNDIYNVRAYNILKPLCALLRRTYLDNARAGKANPPSSDTLGILVRCSPSLLLGWRNCGKKTVKHIETTLGKYGLALGMRLDPPTGFFLAVASEWFAQHGWMNAHTEMGGELLIDDQLNRVEGRCLKIGERWRRHAFDALDKKQGGWWTETFRDTVKSMCKEWVPLTTLQERASLLRTYTEMADHEGWSFPVQMPEAWEAADVKHACREARKTKSKTDSDVLFLADLAEFRKISLQQMARETVLQPRSKAWLLRVCEGDGVAIKGVAHVESMRQKIADGLTATNVKRLRQLEEERKRLALEKSKGILPAPSTKESLWYD